MSKSGCIFKEKSAPLKSALLSHLVHFITYLMIKNQKKIKKEDKKIREVGGEKSAPTAPDRERNVFNGKISQKTY